MSAETTSWVWDNFPYSGDRLVLMLVLSDNAFEGITHLSLSFLAERIRLSEESTLSLLIDLQDKSQIEFWDSHLSDALYAPGKITVSLTQFRAFLDSIPKPAPSKEYQVRTAWERARKAVSPVVFRRDNHTCVYCGSSEGEKLTVDHILPISRGGTNALDNLATACKFCNTSKGTKTLVEWKASE